MFVLTYARVPRSLSNDLFWFLHPGHVLLSAFVTTALYRRSTRSGFVVNFIIGYVGSVGIATLSDSLIPFAGELLLGLPYRGVHVGFLEKWWLVNPLVVIGITAGFLWPKTYVPHTGHVFLSTWASLFHMTMALGDGITPVQFVAIPIFLLLYGFLVARVILYFHSCLLKSKNPIYKTGPLRMATCYAQAALWLHLLITVGEINCEFFLSYFFLRSSPDLRSLPFLRSGPL
jgi:hypothetical protein